MNSLSGNLLVSVPALDDPNFFRSVVVLLRHDAESATGLVLNRPTKWALECAMEDVPAEDLGDQAGPETLTRHLFWGGPVEGPLMALHGSLALAEMNVLPGVNFLMERGRMKQLVMQSRHPFRVYSGYCGWGPGQLEREIAAGGWLSCPADETHIFCNEPGLLWQQLCELIGYSIIFAPRPDGPPLTPIDPGLN
jgi:putative transcriptional regulator